MQKWALEKLEKEKKKIPKTTNEEKPEYCKIPEDNFAIHTVDNDQKLKHMIECLSKQDIDELGVDSENDPYGVVAKKDKGGGRGNEVVLLQIAKMTDVFFFRKHLMTNLDKNLLSDLGTIISKKRILFFDSTNDHKTLEEFIPNCKVTRMLDLQKIAHEIGVEAYNKHNELKSNIGLSDVAVQFVG